MNEETTSLSYIATSIFSEIGEFLRVIRSWIYLWVFGVVATFFLGVEMREVFGYMVPVPDIHAPSLASLVFTHMTATLVPVGVTLVALNPFSAFSAQLLVAALCSLIVTFPVFVSRLLGYLSPALYAHERRALVILLGSAGVLFMAGCMFGYTYILPTTLHFLYGYVPMIDAMPFFSVTEFVALVVSFTTVTGICFLLPIAMVFSSRVGIVSRGFWWQQWRGAFLLFLIVSAIITPDGSGVSMMLLALPLTVLYGVGASVSSWSHHRVTSTLSP